MVDQRQLMELMSMLGQGGQGGSYAQLQQQPDMPEQRAPQTTLQQQPQEGSAPTSGMADLMRIFQGGDRQAEPGMGGEGMTAESLLTQIINKWISGQGVI